MKPYLTAFATTFVAVCLAVVLSVVAPSQTMTQAIVGSVTHSGVVAITLDASCSGSSSGAISASCSSPMTVTAGDTITCEGYKNNNFDPGELWFNDNVNGYYASVAGYSHPTSTNIWTGSAIFENSASGTITPQVSNWESTGIGIHCQAWKGVPTSAPLDGGG